MGEDGSGTVKGTIESLSASCPTEERTAALAAAWFVVAHDELLSPEERWFLDGLRRRLNLDAAEATRVESAAAAGRVDWTIPAGSAGRQLLLACVLEALTVDGGLRPGAAVVAQRLSDAVGLDRSFLDGWLRDHVRWSGPDPDRASGDDDFSNDVGRPIREAASAAAEEVRRLLAALHRPRSQRTSKLSAPWLVLILSGLVPVAGVLFARWPLGALIYYYWAETVVIFGFGALRMLCAEGGARAPLMAALLAAGKALVAPVIVTGGALYLGVTLVFIHKVWAEGTGSAVANFRASLGPIGVLSLLPCVLTHAHLFHRDFIGRGEYRWTGTLAAAQPVFLRLGFTHLALFLGSFSLRPFPLVAAVVLGGFRVAAEFVWLVRATRTREEGYRAIPTSGERPSWWRRHAGLLLRLARGAAVTTLVLLAWGDSLRQAASQFFRRLQW